MRVVSDTYGVLKAALLSHAALELLGSDVGPWSGTDSSYVLHNSQNRLKIVLVLHDAWIYAVPHIKRGRETQNG